MEYGVDVPVESTTKLIVPSAPEYSESLRRKDNNISTSDFYQNGNFYTDSFNSFARNTLRKNKRKNPNKNTKSDIPLPPPPAYSSINPQSTSHSTVKLSKYIKLSPNPPEPENTILLIDTSFASKQFVSQIRNSLLNLKFYKKTSPHLITFSDDIVVWRKHDQLLLSGNQLTNIFQLEEISRQNYNKSNSIDPPTFLSDVQKINSSGKSCLYSALLYGVNYARHIGSSFSKIIVVNCGDRCRYGLSSEITTHISIMTRYYGIQLNVLQLRKSADEMSLEKLCSDSGGKYIKCRENFEQKLLSLHESQLPNLKQTAVRVFGGNNQTVFYPGNLATRSDSIDFELFSGNNRICINGKIMDDKEFEVYFDLKL